MRRDAPGHVEIDNARLHRHALVRNIDVDDTVQPREADEHAVGTRERSARQPGSVAACDERNLLRVAQADDLLHLFGRVRQHDATGLRLEARKAVDHWKAKGLDFSNILYQPDVGPEVGRFCSVKQDHGIDRSMDVTQLLEICKPAIERGEKVIAELPIRNVHRVTGTITSGEITKKHGAKGLPEDTIKLKFTGSAGQSFGAFVTRGMTLAIEGDANDYFGKGLSGGKLIIYPDAKATFKAEENMIIGNVALYGASAGEVYIRGMAGERFAVRNSGATTVVEAIGDNGCEYMTGGYVVVLGRAGRNFGAGMSGGIAYVLDETGDFAKRVNPQMVGVEKLDDVKETATVRAMIQKHFDYTKSERAKHILANWAAFVPKFVKVMPKDYKRMLACIERAQAQGLTGDEAIMAAFEENARDTSRVGGN